MTAILQLQNVSHSFGGVHALNNVSFQMEPGEIVGLIGPNGAGKTTLVNVITGVHRATSGRVFFDGADITKIKPYDAAHRGLSRTFQIVQPFPEMTVIENVTASALFGGKLNSIDEARKAAAESLEFVGLAHEAQKLASTLTLASRKRLELAKSLASNPRVLLLDEVNAGLNSTEIEAAVELIRKIGRSGVSVILIEHVLKVVMGVCPRIVVLQQGEVIADGPAGEVMTDPIVVKAYLGDRFAEITRNALRQSAKPKSASAEVHNA